MRLLRLATCDDLADRRDGQVKRLDKVRLYGERQPLLLTENLLQHSLMWSIQPGLEVVAGVAGDWFAEAAGRTRPATAQPLPRNPQFDDARAWRSASG